jgi:hypothetical protein
MISQLPTVANIDAEVDLRVLFSGKQLEPGKTFIDYGIEAHSVLHLAGRLRGGGRNRRMKGSKRGNVGTIIHSRRGPSSMSIAEALFQANETQMDAILKKYAKDFNKEEESESLGSGSEVSGASEEYAYSSRGYDDGSGFAVDDDDDDGDGEYMPISDEGDDEVVDMVREIKARKDAWMLSPSHVQLLCRDAGLMIDQIKLVISALQLADASLIKGSHCSRSLTEYRALTCLDCEVSNGGCLFEQRSD